MTNDNRVAIDVTAVTNRALAAPPGRLISTVFGERQRAAFDEMLSLVAFLADEAQEYRTEIRDETGEKLATNFSRLLGSLLGFRGFLDDMIRDEDHEAGGGL